MALCSEDPLEHVRPHLVSHLVRYGHSKLSKMAACRQLGLDVTGNSAIRSNDPENPTLEPNINCIGSQVAEVMAIRVSRGHGTPILGKRPEGEVIAS